MNRLIVIIMLITFCFSCDHIKNQRKNKAIENIVETWYNKSIDLPDSLLILENGQKNLTETSICFDAELKILSIIDSECSSCIISRLMFWDEFLKKTENTTGFKLLLVYNGPNIYFSKVLIEDTGVPIPIILDKNSVILNNNALFDHSSYRTVLLDNKNKITLIGDFFGRKELEKLYLKEIQKIQ